MHSLQPSWTNALAQWVTALRAAGRAETTIGSYIERVALLAKWAARQGHEPWSIAGDDLIEFSGSRRWAPETRRGIRNAITGFYGWAYGTGRIDLDPSLALPRVVAGVNSRRPAAESAVLEAWRQADPREQLILRLAAELGMRRAEIAVVHADDLIQDLDGWSLLVHGKGNRERVLPLGDGLTIAIREAALAGGGYAFPGGDHGHLTPRWVGTLISRILPRDVTLHQLRHRFATLTHQETGDVRLVQALLGHASLATTQRYIDMHSDQLRAGLERATQRLAINSAPSRPNEMRRSNVPGSQV